MSKATRGSRASQRRRSYAGTLALAFLLTLTFVSACLLVALRERLPAAVGRIAADPTSVSPADLKLAGFALGADLAAACAVALSCAFAIRAIRLTVYTRRVHRHAAAYLADHAPLRRLGIAPGIVRSDPSGQPAPSGTSHLLRMSERSTRLLLLGTSGSGKSVALNSVAFDLTRKRAAVRPRKHAPLPVLVTLGDYARAHAVSDITLADYVAERVEHFGSPGLAARVPRLLRQGRLTLLFDELDAVPLEGCAEVCTALAGIVQVYPRAAVVVACRLEDYEAHVGMRATLRAFDRAVVSGLTVEQIRAALRHARVAGAVTRPRRGDGASALKLHALDVSMTLPAHLAALLALPAGSELPNGRGELWHRYLEHVLEPDGAGDADGTSPHSEQQDTEAVLAPFAVALRATGRRSADILPGQHVGEGIAAAVASAQPLQGPGGRGTESAAVSAETVRAVCEASLRAGLLVTSEDGGGVGFSNGLIEAAYAARWLALSDDGFGALPPELLRPEWHLPLLLWAGAASDSAADLAKRVLRLADTPDAVALRAGLSSPDAAVPMTLAVALAAVAEGSVASLARETASSRAADRGATLQLVNDHLRDVLDLAQIYTAQPDSAERLAEMLRAVDRTAGAEVAPNLVRLATAADVTRLVRSQMITLLGLLSTPTALTGLTELLAEMDPIIRQAVNQAYVNAGSAALPYLERISRHGSAKARGRAAEVLASLGGGAASPATALLTSADEHQRALAVATLGTLRAHSSERALVERLADPSPEVRVAAARALGRLGTAAGLEAVTAHSQSEDPLLRAAVAEAIGLAQASQHVGVALSLLGDSAPPVRAASAAALGLVGDERAVAPLKAAQQDADVWVRNSAQIALRRLGRLA